VNVNHQSIFQNECDSNYHSFSMSNPSFYNSSFNDEEDEYNTDNYKLVLNPQRNLHSDVAIDIVTDPGADKLMESSPNKKPSDKETKEKKFWTKTEDDLLLEYINKTQNKNWHLISEYIKTKSAQQCAYRYNKLLSDLNKKKWNRKDDIKLIELVETYGQNWEIVSREFGDRSERDVEMRFKDKLDPNVKNTKFSEEEDREIMRLYEEYGNDWLQISRFFKNRHAKMIKKRFQTVLKFNCKKPSKRNRNKPNIPIYIENSLSTRSGSKQSTPRSSQGPFSQNITPRSSQGPLSQNFANDITQTIKKEETFNVDVFFGRDLIRDDLEFDILSANYLKIDLCASYVSQIENIDRYFSQVCVFYTEKSLQLEQALARVDRSRIEIDNIININSQVSKHAESLMCEIRQMQRERTSVMSDQLYKGYIVRYIEIILVIIQQVKVKLNLLQSLYIA